ncbi:MAG: hypothetical protein WCS03_07460 [Bacteroidota bacterium]
MQQLQRVNRLGIMLLLPIFTGIYACNRADVNISIDGSIQLQQIDGIGVNANTASWDESLKPALNMLLDSANMTVWRVIIETEKNWEEVNDNNDPFTFNWVYYNKLFETPKFQKAFEMMKYLNDHGITKGLMVAFVGHVPVWMGDKIEPLKSTPFKLDYSTGGKTLKPECEDELVEMMVSFLYYARNVKHIKFNLVNPLNESDLVWEASVIGPDQFARFIRKLVDRMAANGLGDVKIVGPDIGSMTLSMEKYLPELMKDSVIMAKMAHWGFHTYSGYYCNPDSVIKASKYPRMTFWMTEWNAWRNGLDEGRVTDYNYKFASECTDYLLQLLKNGASSCVVWEGYDAYYEHPPSTWSLWGILGYDQKTKTYTPRKHFYAISQLSKFLNPGTRQIGVSSQKSGINIVAFNDSVHHKVVVSGINTTDKTLTVKGELINLPKIQRFEFFYTDSLHNVYKNNEISYGENSFQITVPANCIYTLDGKVLQANPKFIKK